MGPSGFPDGRADIAGGGIALDLGIQWDVVLAFAGGLALLYLVGWLLMVPLKSILKFVGNAILGGVILWVLNLFGSGIGINIALNPVNALIVGFLGIPGVLLLVCLQWL